MSAPKFARRVIVQGFYGMPLAAVLANPTLARAAAAGLQEQTIATPSGRSVSGVLALPAATPAPAVLLIHEWWGLNDQIKAVAAEFAKLGFTALAVDLYDGKVASDREAARGYTQALDPAAATEALAAWIDWLKTHDASTGKIGTVGWCFGGGWSLNASIAAPVDATVIYYGRVTRTAADLKRLQGPVLGHFGTLDKFINAEMVGAWEAEMYTAGKPYEVHWYEADHAFANPTGGRYDEADARLSWERTLAFFRRHLAR
jgi:carboxymethylenebutenolidase